MRDPKARNCPNLPFCVSALGWFLSVQLYCPFPRLPTPSSGVQDGSCSPAQHPSNILLFPMVSCLSLCDSNPALEKRVNNLEPCGLLCHQLLFHQQQITPLALGKELFLVFLMAHLSLKT